MADDSASELSVRFDALERRIDDLERELAEFRQPPPPIGPAVAPRVGRIGGPVSGTDGAGSRPTGPYPPPPWNDLPIAEQKRLAATPSEWFEDVTTQVVLKWAGLVLLFLAAAFLVSTAISKGWIGPELQLVGAVAIASALIALGLRPTEKIRSWGSSLISVGVAILFTTAGAAYDWLDFGSVRISTVAAVLVVIVGLVLARVADSLLVAIVAFGGALIVPLWLEATDEFGYDTTVAYVLVLVVVFYALHIDRSWPALYALVAISTMFVDLAASAENESTTTIQILLFMTALAHWATPMIHERRIGADPDLVDRLAGRVILVVPVWLWGATAILHDMDGGTNTMLIAVGIASVAVVGSAFLEPAIPRWLWASQLLAASIVLSAGFISWLDGSTLLGVLAVQALAMLALSRWIDDEWFEWQSVGMAVVILAVTGVLTARAIDIDPAIGDDLIHLFVFAATAGIAYWLRDRIEGQLLALAAYIGVLAWVLSVFVHVAQGQVIISGIWAAIGVGVVVAGLALQRLQIARIGLATLALVVTKLLSVDLAEVETFWRAGLFFLIGLGFLWLSSAIPGLMAGGDDDDIRPDQPTDVKAGQTENNNLG